MPAPSTVQECQDGRDPRIGTCRDLRVMRNGVGRIPRSWYTLPCASDAIRRFELLAIFDRRSRDVMHRLPPLRCTGVIVAVICALAPGCRASDEHVTPAIAFTVVPLAAAGGTDDLAVIAGRVSGARPGNRVVLFARSGVWWVQPFTVRPFTDIA